MLFVCLWAIEIISFTSIHLCNTHLWFKHFKDGRSLHWTLCSKNLGPDILKMQDITRPILFNKIYVDTKTTKQ